MSLPRRVSLPRDVSLPGGVSTAREVGSLVAGVIEALVARGQTLALAESLTGGLLAATIVAVPGASRAFRGGLIVYATDLKESLALVPRDLLAERGPVDPDVALALARGAATRCAADWGLGTTGVAGPDPQGAVAVGTVYVAVAGTPPVAGSSSPGLASVAGWVGGEVRRLTLDGDRAHIRAGAVVAALDLLAEHLATHASSIAPR